MSVMIACGGALSELAGGEVFEETGTVCVPNAERETIDDEDVEVGAGPAESDGVMG
jgi:hypothetical protein